MHTFVEIEPGQWVNDSVPWIVQEFQVTAHVDRPYTLLETEQGFEFVDSRSGLRRLFDFESGRLREIIDRNGNRIELQYTDSLLTRVADEHGRELILSYAGGFLQSLSDGARVVQFEQTGCRLTGVISPEGRITTYEYATRDEDCDALVTATVLPGGAIPSQQIYGVSGAVESQTTTTGTTTFEYCHVDDFICFEEYYNKVRQDRYNLFQQARVTDARGNVWEFFHDTDGRLRESSGPAGFNSFEYSGENAQNRVDRSQIYHGSTSTGIERDSTTGAVRSIRFADNSTMQPDLRAVSTNGAPVMDLFGVELPNGTTETFERDDAGNITRVVDATGESTTYTYDSRGLLTSSTDPEGNTTTYTYDAAGMRTSITNARGNTIRYGYDGYFRRTTTTLPDGTVLRKTFDDDNFLVSSTDGRQATTTYSWYEDGRLESITNPAGETQTFDYDDEGRITSYVDATGGSESSSYNGLGKIETRTDASGNTTTYQHDSFALNIDDGAYLTGIVDPEGNSWSFGRDEFGALVSRSTPLGHTAAISRDGLGRPMTVTDALGGVRSYAYDNLGSLISKTDEKGLATTYEYDARGLVTAVELADGVRTELLRDRRGFVISAEAADVGPWQRAYDQVGNVTAMTDPVGNTTSIVYDANERMALVTLPTGTITVEHDPDGRVTRRSFSDGTAHDFEYDAAGRLVSATGISLEYDAGGGVVKSNGIVTERDNGGRATSTIFPSGLSVSYSYDGRDLPTLVADGIGGSAIIAYDADGRTSTITRTNGTTTTYSYDAVGRIVGMLHSHGTDTIAAHSLVRDERGDIVEAVRTVPVGVSIDDDQGDFASDRAGRVNAFSYDAAGLRTQDSQNDYGWNLASQLTSLTNDLTTVEYQHDAYGLLTDRVDGTSESGWIWNYATGLPTPVIELSDGSPYRYYVHSPLGDLLWSVSLADTSRHYYHYDEIGNTTVVTDDDGGVVAAYQYDPYGRVLGSEAEGDVPFTWGGRFGVLTVDGIYHMRSRPYDAASGQFLAPDPVDYQVHPYGLNPYVYAMANPIRLVDPIGAEAQNADRGWLDPSTLAKVREETAGVAGVASLLSDYQADKYAGIAGSITNLNSMRANFDGLPPIRQEELARAKKYAEMYTRSKDLTTKLQKASSGPAAFRPGFGNADKLVAGYDQVVEWKGFYDKIEAITDEGNRAQDATLAGLDGPYAEIRRQLKLGIISQEEAETHVRNLSAAYDEMNRGIADATKYGILTEAAVRFNDALGGVFLKFPTSWVTRPFTAIGNRVFGDD